MLHVTEQITINPYLGYSGALDRVLREIEAGAASQLRQFVKEHSCHHMEPDLVNRTGFAAESILLLAQRLGSDLIVMGTHGRRGIDRIALGSVTERVLRKASCPVLAVRKPAHDFVDPNREPGAVELWKILFCTDFSENSNRALNYALSLSAEYRARLTVVHVLEELPSSIEIGNVTKELVHRMEDQIPLEFRRRGECQFLVRIGKAYEQIIQLGLESKADLIVMGVMGRNALDLALFGSTTHRVLELGTCPVFVVPPEVKTIGNQKGETHVSDSSPIVTA